MLLYRVLFPLAIGGGFIYSHEGKPIEPGVRVLVDFRGKKRVGIVWERVESRDGEYEIKSIESVLDEKPVLSRELIDTIEFIAFYYMSFKGLVLKSALPSRVFNIVEPLELSGEGFKGDVLPASDKPPLTAEQKRACDSIKRDGYGVYLLFGVTGSGKTEVYLRVMEDVLKSGKKVVVLVPEIVLTPQYISVFVGRFGEDIVGVFHSRLTPKQRFENWLSFLRGTKRIMIGTRSAVFTDMEDVGLVVVDEENDESYKQESEPRYNARDVAIYRASRLNIPVILCSATPSIESYYKAKTGKYRLLKLTERASRVPMPSVEIVKLEGDRLFDDRVIEGMRETLNRNKGVAVLINRRGFANYVVCADCGYLFRCPNCSVTLTYHKSTGNMKCHWCDSVYPVPKRCPECGSLNILDRGVGAQKIEEELRRLFPDRDIERFDRDSVSSKREFERILKKLRDGRIDILVGTQMLSKGHDISHIGLVVIANLEQLFTLVDFRAAERAVGLVIQTAGRAGRKETGNVIVQSISGGGGEFAGYIVNHDYESFAESELKNRRLFNYPPFSRLIRVIAQSTDDGKARGIIEEAFNEIKGGLSILGPARCPLHKVKNRYRYHMLIKTGNILESVGILKNKLQKFGRNLHFDVDPISFF